MLLLLCTSKASAKPPEQYCSKLNPPLDRIFLMLNVITKNNNRAFKSQIMYG